MRLRLAPLLAVLLLAALAWRTGTPVHTPAEVIQIKKAQFLKSDGPQPPPAAGLPWEERSLPDFWRTHRASDSGFGWYRAGFDVLHQPDTPWSVFVPFANSALAVRVNGVEIGREPAFDASHISARASPPHLVTVPATLLAPGRNTLELHLRVERDINSGVSRVEVGPQEWMQPRYLEQRLWRIDLPRALNMASLVAILFMALLWLRRPSETIYPWFCALAAVWAVRAMYFTADDAWLVPARTWLGLGGNDLFLAASLSLGFALLYIVVNRFARGPQPVAESIAIALCVALPLAIAPLGNQVLAPMRPLWWGLAVVLALLAVVTATRLAWRERHWSYALIVAGIFFMLATCLHDWLVVSGLIAFSPVPWLGYGPPVMLGAMVVALGGRYFHAFDEAGRLNRELDQRVRDKTMELEQHYDRIAQLERVAAVAGERDRLMRDMHDGVGSQLITLEHALEKGGMGTGQAAALVRECIDDLRLVIDSLDAGAQSMSDALANLRFRVEPRLAAAGIASQWELAQDEAVLAPGVVLQLLRILQEALTNTLKHSGASTVRVHWRIDTGSRSASLCVQDDGQWRPPTGQGRGQDNMRQRAERAGATVRVSGGPGGTTVAVSLDLGRALPG